MGDAGFPHPPGLSHQLFELLYKELRELARQRLSEERPCHSLRPTELVHEVFLRLSKNTSLVIQSRAHFLGLAGRAMRRVLVEHARRKATKKRGGGELLRVTLDEALDITDDRTVEILKLDDALRRLEKVDAVAAEVVVHRFFGGLTEEEIGELMGGRKERWVRNQWAFARAWLKRELARG